MESPENTQAQPQTVSSAQQFKQAREAREKGDVITLSSGLSVRLKRPDVTQMISRGLIPSNMVQGFMSLQGKDQSKITGEDVATILQFQREMAKHALTEPKVVDEPNYDNGEISIDDLSSDDLGEVWQYVNGGLEAVEKFRKERNTGVLPGLDSQEIPTPPSE